MDHRGERPALRTGPMPRFRGLLIGAVTVVLVTACSSQATPAPSVAASSAPAQT